MFASPYSANVILAKARAMYGRSLKAKDFNNLLNCHSVSEVAAYLKNNTSYATVLSDINEATIHRGHLEMLMRRKMFVDYASLARYDLSTGLNMSAYLIQRAEIELIISCLRLMSARRADEFFFAIPLFLSAHTHLDLMGMSRSKTYADLLAALQQTRFYDVLNRFAPDKDGQIPLTEIETALYTLLTQTMIDIINHTRGKENEELKDLYGTQVDVQNVTRILRLKQFFHADADTIRRNLLPPGHSIPAKTMENMITAPTADAVMSIFWSTKVGHRIPEAQRQYIHDLHHRAPYFNARHHIHFSVYPSVTLMSYLFIIDMEIDDIVNIIEGIRYGLQPDDIRPMLVLANE